MRAEPGQLDTPQCSDQHVALKIAFACMNKVHCGNPTGSGSTYPYPYMIETLEDNFLILSKNIMILIMI